MRASEGDVTALLTGVLTLAALVGVAGAHRPTTHHIDVAEPAKASTASSVWEASTPAVSVTGAASRPGSGSSVGPGWRPAGRSRSRVGPDGRRAGRARTRARPESGHDHAGVCSCVALRT